MDLFKIHNELIADRTAEAWYQTKIAGPFFHYRWSFGFGRDGDFSNIDGEHHSHAVCREEPNLTMSWGLDVDGRDEDRRTFDWATKFPDPTVRLFWVDFFWNNALIDRVELCRVDGSRGVIPHPNFRLEVTDFETAVAFLIHDLERGSNPDNPTRYMDRIGLKRVPDEERHGAGTPAR